MPEIRVGKTVKDHRSGAHGRRASNREARNAWCNDPKRTQGTFPYSVCNGKRNKTRFMKRGKMVVRTFEMQKGW